MEGRELLDRLVAVGELGNNLEAVGGRENSRKTRSDDRLVIDDGTARATPSCVGPAANSPPSADARSCIPSSP